MTQENLHLSYYENEDNLFTIHDFSYVLNNNKMHIPSDETMWTRLRNHNQKDIIIIPKKGDPSYGCLKKRGI